jgi:hypothetical protein
MRYFNLSTTGTLNQIILTKRGPASGDISYVSIANTSDTISPTVSLYLNDQASPSSNYYHFIANVVMPVGTTLVLDKDELAFDRDRYSLVCQVKTASGTATVTVMIK